MGSRRWCHSPRHLSTLIRIVGGAGALLRNARICDCRWRCCSYLCRVLPTQPAQWQKPRIQNLCNRTLIPHGFSRAPPRLRHEMNCVPGSKTSGPANIRTPPSHAQPALRLLRSSRSLGLRGGARIRTAFLYLFYLAWSWPWQGCDPSWRHRRKGRCVPHLSCRCRLSRGRDMAGRGTFPHDYQASPSAPFEVTKASKFCQSHAIEVPFHFSFFASRSSGHEQ